MPKISINGVSFYYKIMGQGEPLFLIPGILMDHTSWLGIDELLAKEFQVITYDHRSQEFTLENASNDLYVLINVLNIKNAYILGFSMGSSIALYFTSKHPEMVRKLALCSAYVKLEEVIEYVFQKLIYLLPTISFEKVIELFLPWVFSRALWKKPDVIKKIHNEIFFTPLRKLLTHLFKDKIMTMVSEQLEAAKLFNAKTCTSKIQIPTLILSGGDDLLFPTHHPKELHKLISGSTLKILPHVAHDLRIECPRRFFEETRAFFL